MRSVPFSARISEEDAEFLALLQIDGAKTPSDKLRALLAEARRRYADKSEYVEHVQASAEWLAPARRQWLAAEHALQMHSPSVQRVMDWLPETLAFVQHAAGQEAPQVQDLRALEKGVMERVARLCESMLQLAFTPEGMGYQPREVRQQLAAVLQLAHLLQQDISEEGER